MLPPATPNLSNGHVLSGDATGAQPLVVASPHSGREYPADFLARTRLSLTQLRRAEDAYVDTLLDGVVPLGVPRLAAQFGRSWLDLNRAPDELDPAMFVEPLDVHADQASERVQAGLGVVPRVAAQGLDIYPTRLRVEEARVRIDRVHTPWHAQIAVLTARARARHGYAVLLDCHSMPTPASPYGGMPPQIVVGDLYGTSAAPALVALIEGFFRGHGLRVSRNIPYAGGYTTQRHGRPGLGIHAVQIEIDRALYMDPSRLSRHLGFQTIAAQLTGLVQLLCREAPTLDLGSHFAEAAE